MPSFDSDAPGHDVDVISEPVCPEGVSSDADATVAVVGMPDDYATKVLVLASMRRLRRSEHEELHAQLFVDDAFVDAVRAPEVEFGGDSEWATFVARFDLPPCWFDGAKHRARVSFASSVSGVVLRGEGDHPVDGAPHAIAEADFIARVCLAETGT